MKALALGLWAVIVALGAAYGAAVIAPARSHATAEPAAVIEHQKTRVLNVPMIAEGALQGFMAMQFDISVDASALKSLQLSPEVYLLDEAFRTVYADATLDFHDLKKYDINGFTRHLVEATNTRLGAPLIKDVLIVDFSYVSKDAVAH